MNSDHVRLARPSQDASTIAAIYAHSVATPTSFEIVAPGAQELTARITALARHAPWLVLERNGELVGYAYAGPHRERAAYRWSVDTSVYVDAAHARTGVGRALYRVLFTLLRLQGFFVAHAGITLPNAASVRLHESCGFESVGVYRDVGFKLGAFHDVGWWRLALQPALGEPRPPRTPAELCADPAWQAAFEAMS
jgi:L-amino acid N-acyltransferase YncA